MRGEIPQSAERAYLEPSERDEDAYDEDEDPRFDYDAWRDRRDEGLLDELA